MLVAVIALAVLALALVVVVVVLQRRLAVERAARAGAEGEVASTGEALADARAAGEAAGVRATEAEARATAAEEHAEAARREATTAEADAERRVRAAEEERLAAEQARTAAEAGRSEADRTVAETAALAARLIDDGSADPAALWTLERWRSERTWRNSVAAVAGAPSPFAGSDQPLRVALEIEAAAIREEVGAVVDLAVDLPEPLTPGASLATLRVTQEVLAAAAKKGEATAVEVSAQGTDVVIRVESLDGEGNPLPPVVVSLPPSRLEADGPVVRVRDALAPVHDAVDGAA